MYIKVVEEVVTIPYNMIDLKNDYPMVSFPAVLPVDMSNYNMFLLKEVEKPIGDYKLGLPILVNGVWNQTWEAIEYTQEEIDTKTELLFRRQRDILLEDCDNLINIAFDNGVNLTLLKEYRQALRDSTINWIMPEIPEY